MTQYCQSRGYPIRFGRIAQRSTAFFFFLLLGSEPTSGQVVNLKFTNAKVCCAHLHALSYNYPSHHSLQLHGPHLLLHLQPVKHASSFLESFMPHTISHAGWDLDRHSSSASTSTTNTNYNLAKSRDKGKKTQSETQLGQTVKGGFTKFLSSSQLLPPDQLVPT